MVKAKEKTPKSYTLKVSKNALQNIDDITGYIAFIKHQPSNAIRIGDKIFATLDKFLICQPIARFAIKTIPLKRDFTFVQPM
jgi:hypothetical protein